MVFINGLTVLLTAVIHNELSNLLFGLDKTVSSFKLAHNTFIFVANKYFEGTVSMNDKVFVKIFPQNAL